MATPQSNPSEKMKTLIVASDGSEYSEGAVREAIQWAKRCAGTLYAVCTAEVGLGQLMYSDPDVVREVDRAARGACQSVKDRAEAEGVACETIIHEGEEPYKHIVMEAQERNAHAIVMGRRGRRGLMKVLMGSATALTIGHAPCPVFVVPRTGKLSAERVLVATDGSPDSERAVNEAIDLAKCTGGSIIGCSIVHGGIDAAAAETHAQRVLEMARAEGLEATSATGEGAPYEAILTLAKEHNADLIVVGSHGRTGLKKLMMGSVTERVVGLTDRAVLVVK